MKYLSDYMEEKQTALFKKTGTIFAFSDKQFEEGKVKGKLYSRIGQGVLTEKGNEIEVIEGLNAIYKESIKTDIRKNGKDKVILRELLNHEAFYTGDLQDTIHKLEDYPFTEDDINHIYQKNYSVHSDN